MRVAEMNREALEAFAADCKKQYEAFQAQGLKLDMSRGKPSPKQLDLTNGITNCLSEDDYKAENGLDCRNYGCLDGLPEAKAFFAPMLGVKPEDVIVCGNSSLNIMYWAMSLAMTNGVMGSKPWGKYDKVKVLCPVPGYDRHFAVSEFLGMELVNVPMKEDGPDMDIVEKLVAEDDTIKAIWCVPMYSNPGGVVYSDAVVKRFAALKPKAKDFRIFWDNAYCVHAFEGEPAEIPDIIAESEAAGNPDIVYEFASTSKVTFPGAGIAAVATSPANQIDIRRFLKYATIGPDKLNQLRHARYFKNTAGLRAHMRKHAALLQPKFEAAYRVLSEELGDTGAADWTTPSGGYFFSFNTPAGCASEIVRRCEACGVKFTPAGATYPRGVDPEDRNIRIAPSFATVSEIETATRILALCTKMVGIEKRMRALAN